ncbi:MAG: protein-glutamate O-methyltransferase CheR [Colwellia sp.]|uniref:CheR family methyltransferase n=1 Tax=Colwellia sp. TaxID=56799 RepID=UPI001DD008C4|nr:protein-glutamate O-methyltransferase CheR [Colwellia sp.]NQY49283.1 protein-glutamate O-methyltransferase CheR [Colwellia sp.]
MTPSTQAKPQVYSHRPNEDEVMALEIKLLLQAIAFRYDYDFSHYAQASLTRRINNCLKKSQLNNIAEMIPKVLHQPEFFELFLKEMSVTVTEMFRDPKVFKELRNKVFTQLKTYSRINIWHAGCATGEEVYSLAIMLKEEGLLHRCQIYATDFNNQSLKVAEQGIYKAEKISEYTHNYQLAGGKASFADYYQAKHGYAKIHNDLKEHITFAHHNLIKDQCFAQMHLIICRNVLIYFDKTLQNNVLSLFNQSLLHRGYLLLGDKESLEFSKQKNNFDTIAKDQRIYQKISYE